MAIGLRGRTRNPKKGMVPKKRADFREGSKTISNADRRMMEMILDESGKTISDSDRARLMGQYINRNDGGIAKKTRTF